MNLSFEFTSKIFFSITSYFLYGAENVYCRVLRIYNPEADN